ncbi:hypothetical protein GCM10011389_33930 [Pontibacillus salipaludis]|uniref:Uncharacterized protein n=1 Tax=Pontibacillus salipaludis TaxID=1697394 RepID=A0ABQ1QCW4_9BACI|nr:hypothetical protein GCM10011389_33930 [Pontibacillus salipaludis]
MIHATTTRFGNAFVYTNFGKGGPGKMRDSRGKTGFRDPTESGANEEAREFVHRKASVFPGPPYSHPK